MRKSLKILAGVAGVALAAGLYFADDLRGYYAFHQVCEREAGLKVDEPLKPGMGWGVPEGRAEAAALPVSFEQVAFVRFRSEKDNQLYDVVRAPRIKTADPGYAQIPVDPSRTVMYRFDRQWGDLPGNAPISMLRYSVTNVTSETLAASYTHFSYGAPDTDAAGAKDCQDDVPVRDGKTGTMLPSRFRSALAGAFAP